MTQKIPENGRDNNHFDVIILGSGMSGTQMGAILAKQQFRVLIIEESSHPRFTIGESSIPETSLMNRIIADRYGIPELDHITSFYSTQRYVSSSTGIKRNFGFVFHKPGQEHDSKEFTQCVIPELPWGPESHYYRQDVDAYLLQAAIKYGCTVRQKTKVTEYHADKDGVAVTTAEDERFTGRYMIDCGGPRAPLATKFNLREEPCRFKTHSRSLYTHMLGVKPFDDIFKVKGQRWRWHEGTLHHMFEGGWLWVIPFNNHPRSTNNLVSVGLQLDPRVYPKTDISAQQEFDEFLARFPSIGAQFRDAVPVRDWVKTDRLQFSSTTCIGDRYCLMLHANGFIDPLFSRGLENTAVTIHALAARLIKALRDDDFSLIASSTSNACSKSFWTTTTTSSAAATRRSRTSACGTRSTGCGQSARSSGSSGLCKPTRGSVRRATRATSIISTTTPRTSGTCAQTWRGTTSCSTTPKPRSRP